LKSLALRPRTDGDEDDGGDFSKPGGEEKTKKKWLSRAELAAARKEKRDARNPRLAKKKQKEASKSGGFEVVAQEEAIDPEEVGELIQEAMAEQQKNTELIGPQMGKEKLTEALAIGTAMVSSAKRRQMLIDNVYNRYAFDDEDLPSWFIEDEKKYNTPDKPFTKAEIIAIKQKFLDINARPIKKIAEAKARKRQKLEREMVQVRQKADQIARNEDSSNRDKMKQLDQLYRGMSKKNLKHKSRSFVLGKTGKKVGGAKGGKVKLVDARMKKELRAKKRIEKGKGKRGGKRK
jgi:AdoMet-dependent rRNA methyltransferase SPB1